MRNRLCEVCLAQATHVCSGLDVPALNFCAIHAAEHKKSCPDVLRGAAEVVAFQTDEQRE